MTEHNRFLQKIPLYYEQAQKQITAIGFSNQSTQENDFYLQVFSCRYLHYLHQHHLPYNKFHTHSFYELHCILSGAMLYQESPEISRTVSAGCFILIEPQKMHCLQRLTEDAENFAVSFSLCCQNNEQGLLMKKKLEAITGLSIEIGTQANLLIELILQEFHDTQLFCIQNIKNLLNILITNLIRSVFQEKILPASSIQLSDTRLIDLEKYISDNPNQFFSVADLADYLNITTRQLNNIISNELGISVKYFIDEQKAKQACTLLLKTNMDIHEIGEKLGFSEPNNFTRFFKRVKGMSPGKFRTLKGDTINKGDY